MAAVVNAPQPAITKIAMAMAAVRWLNLRTRLRSRNGTANKTAIAALGRTTLPMGSSGHRKNFRA